PTDGAGRTGWNDLTEHKSIKKHPEAGEVLLQCRRRSRVLQFFDVSGEDHGPDFVQFCNPPRFAPFEKLSHGLGVSGASIFVPDVRNEKFNESPGCLLAGRDDRLRQFVEAGSIELAGTDG